MFFTTLLILFDLKANFLGMDIFDESWKDFVRISLLFNIWVGSQIFGMN